MPRRKRYQPRAFAKLRSIPSIAVEVARPYRTLYKQLVAMHKQDVENGAGGWLFKIGNKSYSVNIPMLRRAHPALFEVAYVDQDELEEFKENMKATIEAMPELSRQVRTTLSRVAGKLNTLNDKDAVHDQRDAMHDERFARIEQKLSRIEEKKSA